MSTLERPAASGVGSLKAAIAAGTVAGLGILMVQSVAPVPSLRIGPAPLVAAGLGTVFGLVYLMATEDTDSRFSDLWDSLAEGRDDE